MSCHLSFTPLSTTYSGINTTNLTILNQANSNTTPTDIHTSTTTDTIKENSGSLANTFDAQAVQHELDVQTRVTQTFDQNRQEVKREINSIIDEANRVLENDPNNKEAQKTVSDMQNLGILVDSISGALYSPSDSAAGTAANALSPAMVYEIGQHFKEEGTEGSAEHILAQTLVAAATASLAGNDALSAGFSAGGAEVIAPILADWMYDKNPQDLTSEEKNTISAIISLGSAAVGATTGNTTDVASSSVAGTTAVEDNRLSKEEIALRDFRVANCHGDQRCIFLEKVKFDILSANNDMKAIGAGIENIYDGLSYSIPNMWNNSPIAAKGVLFTAGGIVALPIVEYGITYAYMNSQVVEYGTVAIDIGVGIFDGNPPNNGWQAGGKLGSELYNWITQ